jgi:hypothetical protein
MIQGLRERIATNHMDDTGPCGEDGDVERYTMSKQSSTYYT